MNTNSNAGIGQHYTSMYFVIVSAVLATLLALALSFCNSGSHPLPTATTEPSVSATLCPSRTSLAASNTATPLPTRANPIDTLTPLPSTMAVPLTSTATVSHADGQIPQRTQYALSARLDYERHHLTVSQTITYVNRSRELLSDLLFVVEPNRRMGVFRLNELHWADGQPVESYTLEGARLWAPLPVPLSSGANIGLSISFDLDLPARSGPFGYTSRQTNLGDWYPFVPPYRAGRGWIVHEPAVIGEHLVYDIADYRVDINLASPATDLTIAASAPAEINGNWHRYRLDAARTFSWSASSEYQVLSESVGPVNIVSYVFPEHFVAGEAALSATADALALYSDLFGPYPHTTLTVVEADFADGMEYDGLYFLGHVESNKVVP